MILRFKKMKFTTSLFYKSANTLQVEINNNIVNVTIFPYFTYSNSYTIISKYDEDFEKTTYIAVRNFKGYDLSNDPDLSKARMLDLINTIKIYKGYRKFLVADSKNNGIILKN